MKHVVQFSGGVSSWAAAKRVAEKHGTDNLILLFADVRMEDEDTYRFLIESAANVYGITGPEVKKLGCRALSIHPVEAERMDERKAQLQQLSEDAMRLIPGLVWISKNETPWDTFRRVRFIGKSGVDPCSAQLKRDLLRKWRNDNCVKEETVVYLGMSWEEVNRMDGVRARDVNKGWQMEAPLMGPPYLTKNQMHGWGEMEGLRMQRLYRHNVPHANCGMACVKAGKSQWKVLLDHYPEKYAWHENQERETRKVIGKDVTILHDQVAKGTTKGGDLQKSPLTLEAFRKRVEGGEQIDMFDWGGCGCAVD